MSHSATNTFKLSKDTSQHTGVMQPTFESSVSIDEDISIRDSFDDTEGIYESLLRNFTEEHLKPNMGLLLLSVGYFFNAMMVVSIKVLETDPDKAIEDRIKPLEILLVRMSVTYLCTLLFMFWKRSEIEHIPFGPPGIRKWLFLRGCMGFFGVFCMYFSLIYISISDAILITFLAPSITIILAWIVLREKLTKYEVVASTASLAGVVLVVRPSFIFGDTMYSSKAVNAAESTNPKDRLIATIVGVVGAFGASCVYIVIRHIGKRAHAIMSVSYFALVTTVISFIGIITIPSMRFQMPNSLKEWLLFGNLGFCGFFYQLLLTMGIQRERAGRGTLMQYVQLIFAIFWDVMLWGRWPAIWSWCGMLLIIGSTLWAVQLKNSIQDFPLLSQEEELLRRENDLSDEMLELDDLSD